MTTHKLFIAVAVGVLAGLIGVLSAQSPSTTAGVVLTGTVKSATGQPLEGMLVTARGEGKTIKTTVFTDERGQYFFPPLEKGSYEMWAQAVGFETARATVRADGAYTQNDFSMKTLEDFSRQLSGPEWLASLPTSTPQDVRAKELFRSNCLGCHTAAWILQNRFDRDGWVKIITVMEKTGVQGGGEASPDGAPSPSIRYNKDEIADYLVKVRGPNSKLNFKVLPRPKGEAARAVITEYTTGSSEDKSRPVRFDGSDWSQGVPTAYEGRGPHDADVDPLGFVWIVYGDSGAPAYRTYGRLDPATGKVTDYQIIDPVTKAVQGSHGVKIDEKGRVWFNAGGDLQMIDSKDPSYTLHTFHPPQGMGTVGGHIQITPQGYIWAASNGGLMFDPATQKFQRFNHPRPGGQTYGVGADSDGNGWWAQMSGQLYDEIGRSDLKTGKSTAIVLDPIPEMKELASPADLDMYKWAGAEINAAPWWAEGPRRLGGDKVGNMWVSDWWGNDLAKIDIKTNKVTKIPYPNRQHVGLYQPVMDKNGMLWVNLMTADRVARYDPKTNTWAEFVLPNRGTETRHMAVDNFKAQVEGWTPYWRTNQLARIQIRTPQQMQALKDVATAPRAAAR
jgi:streptogramin lyase